MNVGYDLECWSLDLLSNAQIRGSGLACVCCLKSLTPLLHLKLKLEGGTFDRTCEPMEPSPVAKSGVNVDRDDVLVRWRVRLRRSRGP